MYKLSAKSVDRLEGLHPKLIECVKLALSISKIDFSVIEGVRTIERQKELVKAKKSWTLNSYHIPREVPGVGVVGCAVDLYPYIGGTSHNDEHYRLLARAMFSASQTLGIKLEWGGFWNIAQTDKPHWQLITD